LDCAVQHHWVPNGVLGLESNLCDQLQGLGSHPNQRNVLSKLSFLLWSIWKVRNNVIFRNEIFKPLVCLVPAKKASAEWLIRSCISVDDYFKGPSSTPSSTNIKLVRWYPPQPGVVKVNFDDSCINSAAAGGFILRDWRGKIIKVSAANYGLTSSLVAEARALKDGVLLAVQAGYSKISMEGDNVLVIQAL